MARKSNDNLLDLVTDASRERSEAFARDKANDKANSKPSGSDAGEGATLYASPVLAIVHEGVADLYELNLVDKKTMANFDKNCLVPVAELAPPDIKALREREAVSQSVLAKYLGIATATLGQWERGLRKPDGPALKLLSLIDRHGLEYIR